MAKKTKAKTKTTATAAYLKPILEAATLLKLRVHSNAVEQLTALLDRLSPDYPGDTLKPVDALAILDKGMTGTVEELAILDKVWPGFNGSVRYTLTPTTLTWKWSAKHTGRYATITVPFPTLLPMEIKVVRYCDMDEIENHGEECQVLAEDEDNDWSSGCNCEGFVEQEVSATVPDWDDETEGKLGAWLETAVIQHVDSVTFTSKKKKGAQ